MLTSKFLDDLAGRIGEAIKSSPAKDIEKNVRAALGTMFSKLDLVTRDEFEVQAQLLLRTRERLEQLEEKARQLEARVAGESAPGGPSQRARPAPVPGTGASLGPTEGGPTVGPAGGSMGGAPPA